MEIHYLSGYIPTKYYYPTKEYIELLQVPRLHRFPIVRLCPPGCILQQLLDRILTTEQLASFDAPSPHFG